MGQFQVPQKAWHHAVYVSATAQRTVSNRTHKAMPGRTVNDGFTGFSKDFTEAVRGIVKNRLQGSGRGRVNRYPVYMM